MHTSLKQTISPRAFRMSSSFGKSRPDAWKFHTTGVPSLASGSSSLDFTKESSCEKNLVG